MRRIAYDPSTDTLFVQLCDVVLDGGSDAGDDLVMHIGIDGAPGAYEIDHASTHPEHLAFVLSELRALQPALAA